MNTLKVVGKIFFDFLHINLPEFYHFYIIYLIKYWEFPLCIIINANLQTMIDDFDLLYCSMNITCNQVYPSLIIYILSKWLLLHYIHTHHSVVDIGDITVDVESFHK